MRGFEERIHAQSALYELGLDQVAPNYVYLATGYSGMTGKRMATLWCMAAGTAAFVLIIIDGIQRNAFGRH